MRKLQAIVLLLLFGSGASFAQEAIDQFELEAETSFFEAQNAQHQLENSKDKLVQEQLETRKAKEKSQIITSQAKETREKAAKERVKIEKQRTALKKEYEGYQQKISEKSKEIATLRAQLEKERGELNTLAGLVREVKKQNIAAKNKIEKLRRERKQVAEYTTSGKKKLARQKRNLSLRRNILGSAGKRKESRVRRPASSAPATPMNVILKSKASKK